MKENDHAINTMDSHPKKEGRKLLDEQLRQSDSVNTEKINYSLEKEKLDQPRKTYENNERKFGDPHNFLNIVSTEIHKIHLAESCKNYNIIINSLEDLETQFTNVQKTLKKEG